MKMKKYELADGIKGLGVIKGKVITYTNVYIGNKGFETPYCILLLERDGDREFISIKGTHKFEIGEEVTIPS